MAKKATLQQVTKYRIKVKKKRPGVHAKTKFSRSKKSKHYKKLSKGQG